ncbi:MAG: hypothetical protein PHN84_09045 [Desulfuromonadaceae bacterium]|nr:hypothetical protein [Desulfuromonadaceae bacterium]MDD2856909.1 hypothetical protein [Desulfuromonadaceae bacterium]
MGTGNGKKSRNEDTNHSVLRENPWYPRHESDRADELVDELDEAQQLRLYDELKTKTYESWKSWLLDARVEICTYDQLNRAQRARRLKKLPDTDALVLHHACIFVELWRAKIHREYFPLPPNAAPVDTPQRQRDLMLNVVASYATDVRDLWPFDHPDIDDGFPFRSDS